MNGVHRISTPSSRLKNAPSRDVDRKISCAYFCFRSPSARRRKKMKRNRSPTTFHILAGLSKEWGKAEGVYFLVFFLFVFHVSRSVLQQWTLTMTTRLVSAVVRGSARDAERWRRPLVNECQTTTTASFFSLKENTLIFTLFFNSPHSQVEMATLRRRTSAALR